MNDLITEIEGTCGACLNAEATREIEDFPVCDSDDCERRARVLLEEMNRDQAERVSWAER